MYSTVIPPSPTDYVNTKCHKANPRSMVLLSNPHFGLRNNSDCSNRMYLSSSTLTQCFWFKLKAFPWSLADLIGSVFVTIKLCCTLGLESQTLLHHGLNPSVLHEICTWSNCYICSDGLPCFFLCFLITRFIYTQANEMPKLTEQLAAPLRQMQVMFGEDDSQILHHIRSLSHIMFTKQHFHSLYCLHWWDIPIGQSDPKKMQNFFCVRKNWHMWVSLVSSC